MKTSASFENYVRASGSPERDHQRAGQPKKPSAGKIPDWLAQPKTVADAEATAPVVNLAQPGPNGLTIGGRSVPTPFAARDLSGPAGQAFAVQPLPNGRLWAERSNTSEKAVTKIVLSHTVCNSVAHSLHVLAASGLSTHGIIDGDGTIHQLVDLKNKAFIAGPFNESVIGFNFQSPVDPRVVPMPSTTGEEGLSTVTEAMPRKGSDLYTHWRISDAQKLAASQVATWLSEQPDFSIVPEVADPTWLPEADEVTRYSGVVGLYQLRNAHVAPGFDAMRGVALHLAPRKPVAGEKDQAAASSSSNVAA